MMSPTEVLDDEVHHEGKRVMWSVRGGYDSPIPES